MRTSTGSWVLAAVLLLLSYSSTRPSDAPRATASQPGGPTREVVLAIQAGHRLHVFDADTLEPLGQIAGLNNSLEHVSVSPDGRTLYLAQTATFDGNSCCALFSLDLTTAEMCHLLEPVMESLPSPDGRSVFAQRGSTGIDVIDSTTRARTTIATFDMRRAHDDRDRRPLRGQYALYPSSDGRWMFGITLWQKPALGIFDLSTGTMVRELAIPPASGAWVNGRFYLYESDAEQPRLFAVNPEMTGLGLPRPITDSTGPVRVQLPARAQLITAGDRLLAYQPEAHWLIPRRNPVPTPGIFVIDPAKGALAAHLAPSMEFAQVAIGTDGQRLYGLDGGPPSDRQQDQRPRLLMLNARTGVVVAERPLPPDIWHLVVAEIPASLVPRGEVHPAACRTAR